MEEPHSAPITDLSAVRILLTVEDAALALSMGRTYVYSLVMQGQIPSIKVGRKRRIPIAALHEYVARQLASVSKGA